MPKINIKEIIGLMKKRQLDSGQVLYLAFIVFMLLTFVQTFIIKLVILENYENRVLISCVEFIVFMIIFSVFMDWKNVINTGKIITMILAIVAGAIMLLIGNAKMPYVEGKHYLLFDRPYDLIAYFAFAAINVIGAKITSDIARKKKYE